jgi:hypothetical protein
MKSVGQKPRHDSRKAAGEESGIGGLSCTGRSAPGMGGRADLPAALCGPPWCDQIPTPTENQLYPYSEHSCAPRHSHDSRKLFAD